MRDLSLIVLFLVFGAHGQDVVPVAHSADLVTGAKVFATSCGACHGPEGAGGRGPDLISTIEARRLTAEQLFRTVRSGVSGTDMPPSAIPDEETWALVAFLLSIAGPAKQANAPGDVHAGYRLFWSEMAGCSTCHAIRGRGGHLGPDLSDLGHKQSLARIRSAILDPSKDSSVRGFETVTVTLVDGKIIDGSARHRNNYSLQVVDATGNLHLISMINVQSLSILPGSRMPRDYRSRLSETALRDLLAYLSRQTVRSKEE